MCFNLGADFSKASGKGFRNAATSMAIYFEQQVGKNCVVHAFDNMAGSRALRCGDLVKFARSRPGVYANEDTWFQAVRRYSGTDFSVILLRSWFAKEFSPQRLTMKPVTKQVYSAKHLVEQVDLRVDRFLFSTCDHLFAARKIDKAWYLFDSQNSDKVLLDDDCLKLHTVFFVYCIASEREKRSVRRVISNTRTKFFVIYSASLLRAFLPPCASTSYSPS